jgi:lipoprotein-anchoring transpeptidase ErfK/SrfK
MRRPVHRHPLQSFRFWFIVLSCFALAIGWKLDLFGNRHAHHDHELAAELPDLSDEELEDELVLDDASAGADNAAPEPRAPRRSIEAMESAEIAEVPEAPVEHPLAQKMAAREIAKPASRSPFGPANPQFEAAGEETERRTAMAIAEQPAQRIGGHAAWAPDAEERALQPADVAEAVTTQARPMPRSADREVQQASFDRAVQPTAGEAIAESAPESAPEVKIPAGSVVNLKEADRLLQSGEEVRALRLMSDWYWKEPQSRPAFQERLDAIASKVYLQSRTHYIEPRVVRSGDVMQTIAREYGVSWQYLAKLNHTDPKKMQAGQKLKVIKGPFGAVVDLSRFELTIHSHGHYVKKYPIGVGRDNSSPVGTFKVEDKLTDPTYYGPDGVIEHDDPKNPLGEYWLSIGDSFGIHGTIDPASIGKAESQGCIRLADADIADVYDFLTVGSDVVIRR